MRQLLPLVFIGLWFSSCKKDLLPLRLSRRATSGTTDRLNNIRFLTPLVGLAIGGERFDHSRLLRTSNGGTTWTSIDLPDADKALFGIGQSANGRVYVIGYDGKMLYSDDLGLTWNFRQLRFEAYKAISLRNNDNPVAIGGISFDRGDIMELNGDGGIRNHEIVDYELNDIAFTGDGRAYRCGYGTIQYSTDSGRTWNWTKFKNDNYSAIAVRDERIWVCGREGSIVRSIDGGQSWERLRNGTYIGEKKYRLNDIEFRNADEGFAVGEKGVVLYTRDGGLNWSELEAFTTAHLYSISLQSTNRIYVCGEAGEIWEIRI